LNHYLLSLILGVIEGLTEFLPVSSTAHLRISEALLHVNLSDGYWKMYSIVIQLGAILCLPVYFRARIAKLLSTFPSGERGDKTVLTHPLSLTMIAFVVTAIPSFLLTKVIGKNLESLTVMGWALLLGGVVMWIVDAMKARWEKAGPGASGSTIKTWNMEDMSLGQSIWIGACQILSAVFPGTSRSMATIAGGQLAGMSRASALEFSFFLSMPTMVVATGYALLKSVMGKGVENPIGVSQLTGEQWGVLALGFVVSFVVAYAAVAWFMAWVRQRGMPQVDIDWSCGTDGKIDQLELRQSDVLNEGGHWPIRTQLLLAYDDAPAERLTVDLMGERAPVRELTGRRCPAYIFGNEGDFGYGRFLLDTRSRVAVTSRLTHITDPFLRTMLLGALWEAVRETQMPPEEYVALVLKLLASENDEELAQSMLARATTAFQRYLSPAQRTELAPALEALCSQRMVSAEPLGLRITFYRAFRSLATTDTARQHLKDLLAGKFSVPGMELKPLDRWQIVRVLLTLADAEAERLFADERKRDISDDGRKLAYVVEASRSDEATKRRYFDDYLLNRQVPEDWIEGSLGGFNSWNQSQVTFQFLKPALEALPQIKRERKIFFVLSWLNAFIGGQQSAEALATVRDFLEAGKLDRDLKLKVMEVMDELERTVRINAKAQRR